MSPGSARWRHEVELASDARSVALARVFVADVLLDHGLSGLVPDVQLVVSELATNAIVHAATVFAVTVRTVGGAVLVEVRDGAAARPVPRAPLALDTDGRGIVIVSAVSRDWGIIEHRGGGKTVWAEFAT